MRVVELLVITQGVEQVSFVPDESAVEEFVAELWIHRSMIAFIRGIRTPLRTIEMSASARTASNRAGNFPSRSRIGNPTQVPVLHSQILNRAG